MVVQRKLSDGILGCQPATVKMILQQTCPGCGRRENLPGIEPQAGKREQYLIGTCLYLSEVHLLGDAAKIQMSPYTGRTALIDKRR